MNRILLIYSPANRNRLLVVSALLIAAIAVVDWLTKPYISLGFLYLFPIMIAGGFLSRAQTVGVAVVCSMLGEAFSDLPTNDAIVRLLLSSAGFIGTGLFIGELVRNRNIVLEHVDELWNQIRLRRDAEEQVRFLVESSPASIVTIDQTGDILLANEAAQQLLAPDGHPLEGQQVSAYLPALHTVVQTQPARVFRTALQCRGQRSNGESFLAGVWFSTYSTASGPRLAAIVVDLSEDLRSREDLSLDHLLRNTRILVGALAHEVLNLCGAILVVHKNLSLVSALEGNEDLKALGTLVRSLAKVAELELRPPTAPSAAAVDLVSVLDEVRILIDAAYRDSSMEIEWEIHEDMPPVMADRYGLVQVFLNLARNSQRAMRSSETKRLKVTAAPQGGEIAIRFEDTGVGIASPDGLFRPFQRGADATGLGLFVSRAIVRSFGGDIVYEPKIGGCRFAVMLPSVARGEGVASA